MSVSKNPREMIRKAIKRIYDLEKDRIYVPRDTAMFSLIGEMKMRVPEVKTSVKEALDNGGV
ncbi:MAG: hypothetical protein SVK08_00345 [Halobacteriota archaeon]|nr:hypothetical protein [Halobacteriota archaeon]